MLGVKHVTHVAARKVQEESAVFKVEDAIVEVSRFTGNAVPNPDGVVTESLPVNCPRAVGNEGDLQILGRSGEHAGARGRDAKPEQHDE